MKYVLVTLFHVITMNENWCFQSWKRTQKNYEDVIKCIHMYTLFTIKSSEAVWCSVLWETELNGHYSHYANPVSCLLLWPDNWASKLNLRTETVLFLDKLRILVLWSGSTNSLKILTHKNDSFMSQIIGNDYFSLLIMHQGELGQINILINTLNSV